MEFWVVVVALVGLGIVIAGVALNVLFWVIGKFRKMRRQHEQRRQEARMERARWASLEFDKYDEETKENQK